MAPVDLRTDTVTLPTQAMRRAMMEADIGDEQKREDPTVLLLEKNAAARLGQSDAVFVPSATMANQIAVRLLTNPGDELIAEESAHMLANELGGPAVHSGVMIRPLKGECGMLDPRDIRAARRDPHSIYQPITRLVCVENTHNASGGSVWEIGRVDELTAVCRELELALHLDGSRLFNAAVACGHPASRIAGGFDSVTLCLSKGLGCPIGAVLAGSADFVARARRAKHLFGGAMRQAGIIAAAGVYALDHHVDRLADDHRRARFLAEALAEHGVPVRLDRVETNFVQLDVASLGLTAGDAIRLIAEEAVLVSGTVEPGVLRVVTHLGISDADIERAVEGIRTALARAAKP